MSETGTYVYAVGRNLDEELLNRLAGVGDAPVRIIRHRDVDVVVSTVDLDEFGETALRTNLESLPWVEKTARRHDEIVRRAAALTTALAPFRLVTIYRSDDAARDRIEELYDDLALALDRIDRRSEWSVKAFNRPPTTTPPPAEPASSRAASGAAPSGAAPSSAAPSGAASSGVAYLQRRRAELRSRQEAAADQQLLADQLLQELAPATAATRRLAPQDQRLTGRAESMALNAAFLVDDDRSTEFFERVNEVRAQYPSFDIELDGPWPPYSFAVLDKP